MEGCGGGVGVSALAVWGWEDPCGVSCEGFLLRRMTLLDTDAALRVDMIALTRGRGALLRWGLLRGGSTEMSAALVW